MIDFINLVFQWINTNMSEIDLALSSTTVTTIVAIIVVIIKSIKSIKDSTKSSNELNASLQKNLAFQENVETLNETVSDTTKSVIKSNTEVIKEVNSVDKRMEELETKFADVVNKLDGVIEIMGIVYSTAKDENVRSAVANIVTSFKYAGISMKNKMADEINQLRDTVKQQTKIIDEYAQKALATINSTEIEVVEESEPEDNTDVVMRV